MLFGPTIVAYTKVNGKSHLFQLKTKQKKTKTNFFSSHSNGTHKLE